MILLLRFHETEFPGVRVTNVSQLYYDRDYPHGLEEIFRAFGKHAGFKNSFYEKYVFPSPGITNRLLGGEIVALNAQPFPDRQGTLGRMVVSKIAPDDETYRLKWISEKDIREIFAQAGVEIPKPVSMPSPSKPPAEPGAKEFEPSPFSGITTAIDNFASIYGLNGPAIRHAFLAFVACLLLLSGLWLWRRSRR